MGKRERKLNEKLMLEYKETNDDNIFTQIINDHDIKRYMAYVCHQKLKTCPTNLYTHEDLMSIAYLVLWQSIHKYRFICCSCGIHCKSYSSYKIHMIAKHEEYSEPLVSISKYVKYNLGVYLQNTIRGEYSLERRTNTLTISISAIVDDGDDTMRGNENDKLLYEMTSNESLENDVIFRQMISSIALMFDEQTREIFNYLYLNNLKQVEIADILYREGRYSSEQSAAVVISRIIKNKIHPTLESIYKS